MKLKRRGHDMKKPKRYSKPSSQLLTMYGLVKVMKIQKMKCITYFHTTVSTKKE